MAVGPHAHGHEYYNSNHLCLTLEFPGIVIVGERKRRFIRVEFEMERILTECIRHYCNIHPCLSPADRPNE